MKMVAIQTGFSLVKRSRNKITDWNDHLDKKYGNIGTSARTEFESKAQAFIIGELLKEERSKANLTQEALAERTGTKKSYISRTAHYPQVGINAGRRNTFVNFWFFVAPSMGRMNGASAIAKIMPIFPVQLNPMIRHTLSMLVLILLSLYVKAQSFNKDSMLLLLRTLPENTDKVNAYIDYAVWMENKNADSAVYYYKKAGWLSGQLKDHEGQLRYARNYTAVLNQLGRFNESLQINQWALQLAVEKKDTLNMAKCETNLANVHNFRGNFETAVTHYLQAAQWFEQLGEMQYLNIIYQNLSVLFNSAEQFQQALAYAEKSIAISRQRNDSLTLASVLINMGNPLNSLHRYDSAIATATQGLAISKKTDNPYIRSKALMIIGNAYAQQKKYRHSIDHFQDALAIARQLQYLPDMATSLHGLSMNYFKMKDYAKADSYAVEAMKLNERTAIFSDLQQQYKLLADIKAHRGDYSKAYHYLQQYLVLADSLNNVTVKKNIQELERKYQVKQKENEVMEKQVQLDAVHLKVQRRNTWLIVLGACALGAAGLFAASFRLQRNRQKMHKEKLISLQKEKELAQLQATLEGQILERKRIAAELHDDLGTGLTAIMFLAEGIGRKSGGAQKEADKIAGTTRKLMNQVNEIVWSMNTEYDTLEDMIAYIRHTTAGFLDQVNLEYTFSVPEIIPPHTISGIARRNIYLVVKEALHNIVKHAEASVVQLSFAFPGPLCIQVADNGKGIDNAQLRRFGNGLKNMRQRMEAINGSLAVEHENGTRIILKLPLGV